VKVFLCYRRNDAANITELIYNGLCREFGKQNVFRDVHNAPIGFDFRTHIRDRVAECDGLLAIIGRSWVEELQRREDTGEDDFVRDELEFALNHSVRVIPLLVDGAELPKKGELPEALHGLVYMAGLEVHDAPHFAGDLRLVIDGLRGPAPEEPKISSDDRGRRRGRWALFALIFLLLALFFWDNYWPTHTARLDGATVANLLRGHVWIGYDPTIRTELEKGVVLDEAQILQAVDRDLEKIQRVGFTGIVTFGSEGHQVQIPRRAKKLGLAVIMGVWDASSRREVGRAFSQRAYVDAYCVGFNGLGSRYYYADLEWAVGRLRWRTGKPVTVTEPLSLYLQDSRLPGIGDWIFPDAHLGKMRLSCIDPQANAASIIEDMRSLVPICRDLDRPLAFNAVAYPHAQAIGASSRTQAEFFASLLDISRDPQAGIPIPATIVPHSAFDDPWKSGHPFYEWDSSIGLITPYGTPRPAIEEILSRSPLRRKTGKAAE